MRHVQKSYDKFLPYSFATLILIQLVHAYNVNSGLSVHFKVGFFKIKHLTWALPTALIYHACYHCHSRISLDSFHVSQLVSDPMGVVVGGLVWPCLLLLKL